MFIRARGIYFAPVLCILMGASPTSKPADLPPPIDKIFNIPPMTLKTNGKTPSEAFAMLSAESGIVIYPFARDVPAGKLRSPSSPPFDLWTAYAFRPLDFDLESVNFWQAVRRIAIHAGVGVRDGGRDVVLFARQYDDDLEAEGAASKSPLAVAFVPKAQIMQHQLSLRVYVDPRVPLIAAGPAQIEASVDEQGRDVHAAANPSMHRQLRDRWLLWEILYFNLPTDPGHRISRLRGYVPITIATKSQTVTLPIDQLGYSVQAGPWTVKLEDFSSSHYEGGNPIRREFVGLEPHEKSDVPLPAALTALVQMVDSNGKALITAGDSRPKTTASGGLREWLEFECALRNGDPAKPVKLLVDAPLEIKQAIVPFEFSDIELP